MGSEDANVSANSDVSGDAADHDRSRGPVPCEALFAGSTLKHRTLTPKATFVLTVVEEIKLDRKWDNVVTVVFLWTAPAREMGT